MIVVCNTSSKCSCSGTVSRLARGLIIHYGRSHSNSTKSVSARQEEKKNGQERKNTDPYLIYWQGMHVGGMCGAAGIVFKLCGSGGGVGVVTPRRRVVVGRSSCRVA